MRLRLNRVYTLSATDRWTPNHREHRRQEKRYWKARLGRGETFATRIICGYSPVKQAFYCFRVVQPVPSTIYTIYVIDYSPSLESARLDDLDLPLWLARGRADGLDLLDDVHALNDLT